MSSMCVKYEDTEEKNRRNYGNVYKRKERRKQKVRRKKIAL